MEQESRRTGFDDGILVDDEDFEILMDLETISNCKRRLPVLEETKGRTARLTCSSPV